MLIDGHFVEMVCLLEANFGFGFENSDFEVVVRWRGQGTVGTCGCRCQMAGRSFDRLGRCHSQLGLRAGLLEV